MNLNAIKHITKSLALIILLSSCATVATKRSYIIHIHSNVSDAKIEMQNKKYELPAAISTKRSKEDLNIKLYTDTIVLDYTVKSSVNPTFIFGNMGWLQFAPAAYLIDFTNPKRFYYGKHLFLDVNDTVRYIRPPVAKAAHNFITKSYPIKKGEIFLHLSLPHINAFKLKPLNETRKINTGFGGISLGLDYAHAENKFLSLNLSAVSDFFLPIPAAVDLSGEFELMGARQISLSQNHRMRSVSLGYGISYSRNRWELRYYDRFDPPPPSRDPIRRVKYSFGLIVPAYIQFGHNFHLGLVYKTSLFTPKTPQKLNYEHIFSFDFAWKIKVK